MARSHYWTCSKFADWLRGTKYPYAAGFDEWDQIESNARQAHPVRFWLAEKGLSYLQQIIFYIPDALYSVKYYINNRWIDSTHCLTAHPRDIKRGQWCDVGNRFLPCLFNELQDFVEVELAWWHLVWADKNERKKYKAPWWRFGWWNVRLWRCPQAGLDNLEWQRNLRWEATEVGDDSPNIGKPTPQAIKAQEILDLYNWWTQTYRNRPDPMEASGWSAHCEAMSEKYGGGVSAWGKENKEEKKASNKAHKLMSKIEEAYEKEDELMMIRLIKVRHGLWT